MVKMRRFINPPMFRTQLALNCCMIYAGCTWNLFNFCFQILILHLIPIIWKSPFVFLLCGFLVICVLQIRLALHLKKSSQKSWPILMLPWHFKILEFNKPLWRYIATDLQLILWNLTIFVIFWPFCSVHRTH